MLPPVTTAPTLKAATLASAGLMALALLSGCASIPKSSTMTPLNASDLASTQSIIGQDGVSWPDAAWWNSFNDPQLNSLITEAFAHAPDMQGAQARLEKAQAQSDQIHADLYPDAKFDASSVETKQSLNMGTPDSVPGFPGFSPKVILPQGYQNLTRIAFDASYDIDLWGKSHAALAGALGNRQAAQLEAITVKQNLAVAVARAYVELDRLYNERDATVLLKKGADIGVQLEQARFVHGLEPKDTVLMANDNATQLSSRISALDGAIKVQDDLIAGLIGEGPDRGLTITRPQLSAGSVQGLPSDVQANLIGRRPDVIAARERVGVAGRYIDYAKADFYPNVTLSAYWGVEALSKGGFQDLFKSGSDIGGIGPAITLPLFHQGRLNAEYHGYEADYDQAVATYNQTLTTALQQVADAAGKTQTTDAQMADDAMRLASAQQGLDLTRLRFSKGLATQIDVLTSHAKLINIQIDQAGLKAEAFNNRLSLIAALGGGFDPAATPAK